MSYKDTYGVEYSEDGKKLIKAPKDLEGEYYVKSGVDTIGNAAFHGCANLRVLHLPSSIKLVDYAAFGECKLLKGVHFHGDLSDWLNINWRSSFSASYLLYINDSLVTEVTIPVTVTTIKPDAFYYCGSLTKVNLHNGITEIGDSAFNKSGITGGLVIPEGVQTIKALAFFNCSKLVNVKLPSSVTGFQHGVFGCCYQLNSISVAAGNPKLKANDECLYNIEGKLLAIAPCASDEPIKLPDTVHEIASDTFCYDAVPKGGLFLSKNITKLDNEAFLKVEKLKVYIPVGARPYLAKLGVPMNDVHEVFSINTAFLPGHHGISAVANNPFRILGVYANASLKEITANARKIKKFVEVGKEVDFPTDFNSVLPPVKRTVEMVDAACATLSNPLEKFKAALFWFVNVDDIDNIGLQNMQAGNTDKARDIFEKRENWHSSLNLSSLAFAQNRLEEAVRVLTASIHNFTYPSDIAAGVCGEEFEIEEDTAARLAIESLLADISLPECRALYLAEGQSENDDEYLNELLSTKYTKSINDAIASAKNIGKGNPQASLEAGRRLKDTTRAALEEYAQYAGENSAEYGMIADRLANQILQCSIDFYNDSIERFAVFDALELAEYALSIVKGQVKKERCKQNVEILRKNAEKVPPRELEAQDDALSELIGKHEKLSASISNIWILLEDAAPQIVCIQECIARSEVGSTEREHMENYRQLVSTAVVSLALSKLIDVVNNSAQHDFKTIIQAWDIMLNLDNFPMQIDFYENRYEVNREKLEKMRAGIAGLFGKKVAPEEPSRSIDMRTSQEVWEDCETIEDYEEYIRRFPKGSHVRAARTKVETLKQKEEDRIWEKSKRIGDYKEYISKYPNGRYSSDAIVAQREVEAKRDDDTYMACKTIAQFTDYLKKYPVGRHHEEAETKLSELKAEDDKAWKACKTKKDCMTYMAEHASGQHIKEAEALIKKIEERSKIWLWVIIIELIAIAILCAYIFCAPSSFQGVTVAIIIGSLVVWGIVAVARSNR